MLTKLANSLFAQASMELIQNGKYISWSLPKNTTIVLSSNPDDGSFSVNSLDSAQKSRFVNFPVKFNIDDFAKWAEFHNMDDRALNFAISYSNELFEKENQLQTINPRSFTMFANAIAGVKEWSNPAGLAMILNISKGCFHDPDNVVGNLFTTFIANKLDKLITPHDILLKKWEDICPEVEKCVYDEKGNYRPVVASLLQTRLLNYTDYYFSVEGGKTDAVIERLLQIIHSKKMLFDEDIIFNIIKTLANKYPQRMSKALFIPEIRQKVIG